MSVTPLKSFHEELVQFTNEFLEKRTGIGFADMVKILEFVHSTKSLEPTVNVETPVKDTAPKVNDYDLSIEKTKVIPVWKCKLYHFVYIKRQKEVLYPASFDRSQLILKSHYKI